MQIIKKTNLNDNSVNLYYALSRYFIKLISSIITYEAYPKKLTNKNSKRAYLTQNQLLVRVRSTLKISHHTRKPILLDYFNFALNQKSNCILEDGSPPLDLP